MPHHPPAPPQQQQELSHHSTLIPRSLKVLKVLEFPPPKLPTVHTLPINFSLTVTPTTYYRPALSVTLGPLGALTARYVTVQAEASVREAFPSLCTLALPLPLEKSY